MSPTAIIIGLTCLVSMLAFGNARLVHELLFWPPALKRGEYWRLLSYGAVHADFTHLFVNMLTLYFFGSFIEPFYAQELGTYGFAGFYGLGIVASILPTWWRHRDDPEYRSLGASGAVMAVLMASVLLAPWNMLYLFFAIPMPAIVYAVLFIAYEVWADRRGGDRINHSAHLWGAAYGVIFTIAVEPRLLPRFLQELANPRFG